MVLTREFAAIVGSGHVLIDPDDLARYNADGRTGGGNAAMVLRPGTVSELSALVRAAVRRGVRLVAQGGRTGLVGAGLGACALNDVIVSLDRFNDAPKFDAANRSVVASAGTLLSTLNAAASRHGLFFPIDLGADPTVGGMVATNTGGARVLRYGDVRHNLMAVQVVRCDADGSVVSLGSGLWKDNSGLDLKQLLVGSSGALGFVTAATLALQPLPAARMTAMLALRRPAALNVVLQAMEHAFGPLLTAFEGISGNALGAALAHCPRLANPFGTSIPAYCVLLELSAGAAFDETVLEDRLAITLAPFMEGGDDAILGDVAIDRGERLWALRHAIPEGLRHAGHVVACDIALPRGAIAEFRQRLGRRLEREAAGFAVHDFGHVGDGGLHFNLVWPHGQDGFDQARADAVRAVVFTAAVEDFGGTFSSEHGIGPANAAWYDRLVPEDIRALAGAVQRQFARHPMGRVDFSGNLTEQP